MIEETLPADVDGTVDPGVVDLSAPVRLGQTAEGQRFFAVVSSGSAATTWLATALNSHPQIFCVHAFNVALRKHCDPGVRVRGLDYAGLIQRLAVHYPLAGDVHGFRPKEIPLLERAFGPTFAAAVLVREPIARLKSQLARTALRPSNLANVDRLVERLQLPLRDLDDETRIFVHFTLKLNLILREQRHGPVYRMEDVTRRAEVLGELVAHLGGGTIVADSGWLERTVGLPPVRLARLEKLELTRRHEEIIAMAVQPEAWAAYEELGYERPSFVAAA